MRAKYLFIIALQVLVLLGMIGYRAYWTATGERVVLRTAPVDPRDLFRGDYVSLSYEISRLNCERLHIREHFKAHEPIYVRLRKSPEGVWVPHSVQRIRPDAMPFMQGRVLFDREAPHYRVTIQNEQGKIQVLPVPWVSEEDVGKEYTFCMGGSGNTVITLHEGRRDTPCHGMRTIVGTISAIQKDLTREIGVEYGIESYFVEEGRGLFLEKARNAHDLKVEIALNSKGQGTITTLILGSARSGD